MSDRLISIRHAQSEEDWAIGAMAHRLVNEFGYRGSVEFVETDEGDAAQDAGKKGKQVGKKGKQVAGWQEGHPHKGKARDTGKRNCHPYTTHGKPTVMDWDSGKAKGTKGKDVFRYDTLGSASSSSMQHVADQQGEAFGRGKGRWQRLELWMWVPDRRYGDRSRLDYEGEPAGDGGCFDAEDEGGRDRD